MTAGSSVPSSETIVGAWDLIDVTAAPYPLLDGSPRGLLVHLPDRTCVLHLDLDRLDLAVAGGSYRGHFEFNDGIVTHVIDAATGPWKPLGVVRWRATWHGDRLRMAVGASALGLQPAADVELVWER